MIKKLVLMAMSLLPFPSWSIPAKSLLQDAVDQEGIRNFTPFKIQVYRSKIFPYGKNTTTIDDAKILLRSSNKNITDSELDELLFHALINLQKAGLLWTTEGGRRIWTAGCSYQRPIDRDVKHDYKMPDCLQ
jgi:hypothetical protein